MISSPDRFLTHTPSRDASERPTITSRAIVDVDGMASAIEDSLVTEYLQLEPRPFEGRWTTIRFPSMVVQLVREDVANVHRLRVPAGRWVFAVPLAAPGSGRWDGHEIVPGTLIVCPPESESFAFDNSGTLVALVSLSPAASPDVVGAAQALLGSSETSQVFTLASPVRRELENRLTELARAAERAGAGRRLRVSQDTLYQCILCCLEGLADSGCLPERDSTRGHVVRRADDFIRRHVGEAVSIGQLSTTAGVSERSLRNAFREVCTTSPKRYLKLWQLHQVRRALRGSNGETLTVTDAATLFGIFELGRFAGEYRALFGETPSQTLREHTRRRAHPVRTTYGGARRYAS